MHTYQIIGCWALLLYRHILGLSDLQFVVVDALRALPVGGNPHFPDTDDFGIPLIGFL